MTNIAIYFNGRCGSTWFMDYLYCNLHNHGIETQCLWEYWAENRVYHITESRIEPRSMHDWKWTEENINQDQLFEDKVKLLESNPGHKLIRFTEHNGYVDKPFDYMLTSNMKWIVMNRRDHFDQMLSHCMCWVTDRWHVWSEEQRNEYRQWYSDNPITIPQEMCENWLQSYLRFQQRRRRLQEAGLILGQVIYERMQDDAMMAAGDLLRYFGVEKPNLIDPNDIKGSTMKLGIVQDKANWITNYDDLLEWYRASEWPTLID